MHVLFVHYEWPGVTDCGGSGRLTAQFRDRLEARGHETTLVTDPADGHFLTFPLRRRQAIADGLATGPDVCFAASTLPTSVGLASLCQRHDVPLVVKTMGSDIHNPRRFTRVRPLLDRVNQHVIGAADRLLVQSEAIERRLPATDTPVRRIPNGIPIDEWTWREHECHDPLRVLTVSRLAPGKGLDLGIEAVAQLRERLPAEYRIVGDGSEFDRLQREHGDREWLGLAGWADDVQAHYDWGDVLLCPSRWESFGLVVAEALACGLPVVVTDCGGQTEVVGERVGQVTPPESAALASGLATVRQRYHSYQRATEGYAADRFSLARMTDAYLDVFRTVSETTRASARMTARN